ncbi:TolC family outer membrane protein [Methylocystis echinoides]|uniref:TolC family outer membrane protein n=1 Tax=Methylocystis echinoides TaxID=29468 RepID=UPI00343902CA
MRISFAVSVIGCVALAAPSCRAETMREALAHAYLVNPQLNAQRANTRGVDENLPIAQGAFLPTASVQGNFGLQVQELQGVRSGSQIINLAAASTQPGGGAISLSLNIFNGFRGINGINQAEAQIFQSRQYLRNIELSVLSAAASAYLNVQRDIAIYDLRDQYVAIMAHQVEITRERLIGGEVTMTDVYQAETAHAQAKQDRATATVNLQASLSVYKQVIGQAATRLAPAPPLDNMLPKSIEAAIQFADANHPLAQAARYNVEIQDYAVSIIEGQLAPTVALNGQVWKQYDAYNTANQRLFQGFVGVQLNAPIYEGGVIYGQARQAKEKLGEARYLQDQQLLQIHQSTEAAWAAWKQSGKFLAAAKEQVAKGEETLAGMREEAKYGQRITLEILNSQLTLVNARIAYVIGQRDRIATSYNLLAAIGGLSAATLGLDVPMYDPTEHFDRVKHQFIGLEPWK